MTTLRFDVRQLGAAELDNEVEWPVEVRNANLSLVARGTTSQTLEVGPGTYFVTAKMPAGQELISQVKIREGQSKKVCHLSPVPEDRTPPASDAAMHYLGPRSVGSAASAQAVEQVRHGS